MSVEICVFVQRDRLPVRNQWQQAIEDMGFPMVLYADFDPLQMSGFCPVTWRGIATGFEYYLDFSKEYLNSYPDIAGQVQLRDSCVTFCFGGHVSELASALAAAASLVQLGNGVCFDPQGELIIDAEQALVMVKQQLELLG